MSSSLVLAHQDLWFRVYGHPEFDENKIYKAVGYIDYAETAWSHIVFINERGMAYKIMVDICRCVNADEFFKEATEEQKQLLQPKAKGRNPQIDRIDHRDGK